jgi:methylmalonyl-CoA/ethylmalonyl-CoA epimerase
VIRRIHHVGIVVRRLVDGYTFYRDTLGLPLVTEAEVTDQGVRAALLAAGETEIELLEPIDPAGTVGRFLARRGEGLHHVCFDVENVDRALGDLARRQVALIDRVPRDGLAGRIGFLHPRACAGVLVELATPPSSDLGSDGWLRVKRLVIAAPAPREAATIFQSLFGLEPVSLNGGQRAMLAAGRGALLFVPASEVGGAEGMVALSMIADEFAALTARLDRAAIKLLRGTGELTLEPSATHGVHLHISRHE